MARIFVFLLTAGVAGCAGGGLTGGSGGSGGAPPIDGLRSIEVAPANQMLVIDGTTPATASSTATGVFNDGHREDITARVSFRLSDATLGRFVAARFTSQTDHGGTTSVLAEAGTVQGSTQLSLLLRQRTNDPGSSNLPPDPGSRFGGPNDPGRAPDLVYPNDGVLVPPNLGKLEFHFLPASGNTLFELSFTNSLTDVKIYLRCTTLASGCLYQPDPIVWRWIAETNRGSSPLFVSIKGTDENGTAVGTSGRLSLSFSKDNINGGLYYWTTSNGTGIMRFDFASTTQIAATRFLSAPGGTQCIGCHALSRDGRKLVAEVNGQDDGRTLLVDVATALPIVPLSAMYQSTFESWNPNGTQFVGVYGDRGATNYNLVIFDAATGAQLRTLANTGTQQNPADHPDWSPDGLSIVFVKVGIATTLQKMHEGAIELVTDMGGGVFGAPVELVARVSGKNHSYHAFSPDGSFIVYDESTCTSGDTECNADSDPSARLFALRVAAGGQPIELARANSAGKTDGGNRDLTTSFPKWSPFVFQRSGELGSRLEWITFSSSRKYGLRNPPSSQSDHNEGPTGTLVWMAGVDPDDVARGDDPSFPAFALPFQDVATSNHLAQWTTAVVQPPM